MKKILIVEDDADMKIFYEEFLSKKYDITIVDTTIKAKKKLDSNRYDLMILDIILPGESGEQFFEKIKKDKKYSYIKTLIISVIGKEEDFFKNIDPKSECLSKPLIEENLLKTIKDMIGK